MRSRTLLTLAALHLLSVAAVAGQAVVGDVLNGDGRSVPGARIALVTSSGEVVAELRADEEGRFAIRAPATGAFRLHVTSPGYRSVAGGPYDLFEGVDLEVYVVLHAADVVELPGVGATVERGSGSPVLAFRGFYNRKEAGFGTFIERKDFEHLGLGSIGDLMRRQPGIRTDRGMRLLGGSLVRSTELYFQRGPYSCRPSLWIDGVLKSTGGTQGEGLRPDNWVNLADVVGLEFYRGPASVPAEYARGAGCAALVIWTGGTESG